MCVCVCVCVCRVEEEEEEEPWNITRLYLLLLLLLPQCFKQRREKTMGALKYHTHHSAHFQKKKKGPPPPPPPLFPLLAFAFSFLNSFFFLSHRVGEERRENKALVLRRFSEQIYDLFACSNGRLNKQSDMLQNPCFFFFFFFSSRAKQVSGYIWLPTTYNWRRDAAAAAAAAVCLSTALGSLGFWICYD